MGVVIEICINYPPGAIDVGVVIASSTSIILL